MATTAVHPPSLTDETPLRLGPVARSMTLTEMSFNRSISSSKAPPGSSLRKYPRIVVKDITGRTLDTFTALQEAIYRANWTRKKMKEWPRTPFEWRLPKAPVPSRPDYSRAGPEVTTSLNRKDIDQRDLYPHGNESTSMPKRVYLTTDELIDVPTVEIPVDDVSFVAESLNHLPNIPSFSFLRQSILAGQSTYVQIVASILLHQRQLRAIDRRDAEWEFPGFCTGCKRAGFCYGCSKNPKPHVHEDVPAHIGGGFRFWKRDRPLDPHDWKHPSNWRLPSTEEELRNIIEEYGGLGAYEQAVLRAKREMAKRVENEMDEEQSIEEDPNKRMKLQRLKNLGTYPPYVTIVSTDDFTTRQVEDSEEEGRSPESRIPRRLTRDESRPLRKVSIMETPARSHSMESLVSEESVDRTLIRVDTEYLEDLAEQEGEIFKNDLKEGETAESSQGKYKTRGQTRVLQEHNKSNGSPIKNDQTATNRNSRLNVGDSDRDSKEDEEQRIKRTTPKFFTVQKQSRKIFAKDPFSTDRELDVPKGPTFQLKKSDKKTTKFVDFKRGDRGWTAPKKFEIKHEDKQRVKPLKDSSKLRKTKEADENGENENDESRRRRQGVVSPDSGRESDNAEDKDEDQKASCADITDEATPLDDQNRHQNENQILADSTHEQAVYGAKDGDDEKKLDVSDKTKRRESKKKKRAEKTTPSEGTTRLPSPPLNNNIITTSPASSPIQSPMPPAEEPPLPEIAVTEIPTLPDIEEKALGQVKKKDKVKFIVEPPPHPPQIKQEPRKRRAAPKVRIIPRGMYRARRTRPAEAPVTSEELMDIHDPLDFLARWCIINPDRLPFYEIIFETVVADQTPPYVKPPATEDNEAVDETERENELKHEEGEDRKKIKRSKSKKDKSKKMNDGIHELNPSMLPTEKGMNLVKSTMTIEEQYFEKIIYTLDLLQDKLVNLSNAVEELEARKIKMLASKARETFPQIASPNYTPKTKKGKKGKKKERQLSDRPLKPHEITDKVIVERLDDKMMKELCREQDMKFLESEIEILTDKISEAQRRVEEIAREKLLTDAFCMNHYFLRQGLGNQSEDFKRQQSELYNRLHPVPDYEMNLEEVEEALQQINNHLLTKKEFYFLYNILDLPGRQKINFRLFSVIAALSEKVTQLDPVIRKMINSFDYNALDVKMEKCKELFDLLEMDHMPQGAAQAQSLAVELTAGGLKPENTRYVLNKFDREDKGVIDFLDFVTYIPLFVEIHRRIIQDPLKEDPDL